MQEEDEQNGEDNQKETLFQLEEDGAIQQLPIFDYPKINNSKNNAE